MFTTVRELLWYYSPVCVTHLVGIGFDSIMIEPLLLSHCCCFFVFWCGVAFCGGFQHPPADGCAKASCNLGALSGGDEYTPFYSAILVLYLFSFAQCAYLNFNTLSYLLLCIFCRIIWEYLFKFQISSSCWNRIWIWSRCTAKTSNHKRYIKCSRTILMEKKSLSSCC